MTPEATTLFMGLTAVDIATLLAAVATFAAMTALWAVMTVRDPMRGRVKALQERREQLKAGIVASRNRASQVQRNSTHDQMRNLQKSMSDRKSVLEGKQWSVSGELGGRHIIKQQRNIKNTHE